MAPPRLLLTKTTEKKARATYRRSLPTRKRRLAELHHQQRQILQLQGGIAPVMAYPEEDDGTYHNHHLHHNEAAAENDAESNVTMSRHLSPTMPGKSSASYNSSSDYNHSRTPTMETSQSQGFGKDDNSSSLFDFESDEEDKDAAPQTKTRQVLMHFKPGPVSPAAAAAATAAAGLTTKSHHIQKEQERDETTCSSSSSLEEDDPSKEGSEENDTDDDEEEVEEEVDDNTTSATVTSNTTTSTATTVPQGNTASIPSTKTKNPAAASVVSTATSTKNKATTTSTTMATAKSGTAAKSSVLQHLGRFRHRRRKACQGKGGSAKAAIDATTLLMTGDLPRRNSTSDPTTLRLSRMKPTLAKSIQKKRKPTPASSVATAATLHLEESSSATATTTTTKKKAPESSSYSSSSSAFASHPFVRMRKKLKRQMQNSESLSDDVMKVSQDLAEDGNDDEMVPGTTVAATTTMEPITPLMTNTTKSKSLPLPSLTPPSLSTKTLPLVPTAATAEHSDTTVVDQVTELAGDIPNATLHEPSSLTTMETTDIDAVVDALLDPELDSGLTGLNIDEDDATSDESQEEPHEKHESSPSSPMASPMLCATVTTTAITTTTPNGNFGARRTASSTTAAAPVLPPLSPTMDTEDHLPHLEPPRMFSPVRSKRKRIEEPVEDNSDAAVATEAATTAGSSSATTPSAAGYSVDATTTSTSSSLETSPLMTTDKAQYSWKSQSTNSTSEFRTGPSNATGASSKGESHNISLSSNNVSSPANKNTATSTTTQVEDEKSNNGSSKSTLQPMYTSTETGVALNHQADTDTDTDDETTTDSHAVALIDEILPLSSHTSLAVNLTVDSTEAQVAAEQSEITERAHSTAPNGTSRDTTITAVDTETTPTSAAIHVENRRETSCSERGATKESKASIPLDSAAPDTASDDIDSFTTAIATDEEEGEESESKLPQPTQGCGSSEETTIAAGCEARTETAAASGLLCPEGEATKKPMTSIPQSSEGLDTSNDDIESFTTSIATDEEEGEASESKPLQATEFESIPPQATQANGTTTQTTITVGCDTNAETETPATRSTVPSETPTTTKKSATSIPQSSGAPDTASDDIKCFATDIATDDEEEFETKPPKTTQASAESTEMAVTTECEARGETETAASRGVLCFEGGAGKKSTTSIPQSSEAPVTASHDIQSFAAFSATNEDDKECESKSSQTTQGDGTSLETSITTGFEARAETATARGILCSGGGTGKKSTTSIPQSSEAPGTPSYGIENVTTVIAQDEDDKEPESIPPQATQANGTTTQTTITVGCDTNAETETPATRSTVPSETPTTTKKSATSIPQSSGAPDTASDDIKCFATDIATDEEEEFETKPPKTTQASAESTETTKTETTVAKRVLRSRSGSTIMSKTSIPQDAAALGSEGEDSKSFPTTTAVDNESDSKPSHASRASASGCETRAETKTTAVRILRSRRGRTTTSIPRDDAALGTSNEDVEGFTAADATNKEEESETKRQATPARGNNTKATKTETETTSARSIKRSRRVATKKSTTSIPRDVAALGTAGGGIERFTTTIVTDREEEPETSPSQASHAGGPSTEVANTSGYEFHAETETTAVGRILRSGRGASRRSTTSIPQYDAALGAVSEACEGFSSTITTDKEVESKTKSQATQASGESTETSETEPAAARRIPRPMRGTTKKSTSSILCDVAALGTAGEDINGFTSAIERDREEFKRKLLQASQRSGASTERTNTSGCEPRAETETIAVGRILRSGRGAPKKSTTSIPQDDAALGTASELVEGFTEPVATNNEESETKQQATPARGKNTETTESDTTAARRILPSRRGASKNSTTSIPRDVAARGTAGGDLEGSTSAIVTDREEGSETNPSQASQAIGPSTEVTNTSGCEPHAETETAAASRTLRSGRGAAKKSMTSIPRGNASLGTASEDCEGSFSAISRYKERESKTKPQATQASGVGTVTTKTQPTSARRIPRSRGGAIKKSTRSIPRDVATLGIAGEDGQGFTTEKESKRKPSQASQTSGTSTEVTDNSEPHAKTETIAVRRILRSGRRAPKKSTTSIPQNDAALGTASELVEGFTAPVTTNKEESETKQQATQASGKTKPPQASQPNDASTERSTGFEPRTDIETTVARRTLLLGIGTTEISTASIPRDFAALGTVSKDIEGFTSAVATDKGECGTKPSPASHASGVSMEGTINSGCEADAETETPVERIPIKRYVFDVEDWTGIPFSERGVTKKSPKTGLISSPWDDYNTSLYFPTVPAGESGTGQPSSTQASRTSIETMIAPVGAAEFEKTTIRSSKKSFVLDVEDWTGRQYSDGRAAMHQNSAALRRSTIADTAEKQIVMITAATEKPRETTTTPKIGQGAAAMVTGEDATATTERVTNSQEISVVRCSSTISDTAKLRNSRSAEKKQIEMNAASAEKSRESTADPETVSIAATAGKDVTATMERVKYNHPVPAVRGSSTLSYTAEWYNSHPGKKQYVVNAASVEKTRENPTAQRTVPVAAAATLEIVTEKTNRQKRPALRGSFTLSETAGWRDSDPAVKKRRVINPASAEKPRETPIAPERVPETPASIVATGEEDGNWGSTEKEADFAAGRMNARPKCGVAVIYEKARAPVGALPTRAETKGGVTIEGAKEATTTNSKPNMIATCQNSLHDRIGNQEGGNRQIPNDNECNNRHDINNENDNNSRGRRARSTKLGEKVRLQRDCYRYCQRNGMFRSTGESFTAGRSFSFGTVQTTTSKAFHRAWLARPPPES